MTSSPQVPDATVGPTAQDAGAQDAAPQDAGPQDVDTLLRGLLVEHNELVLELGPDGGLLVRISDLAPFAVAGVDDLIATLTAPTWPTRRAALLETAVRDGRRDPRRWAPSGAVIKASPDEDLYGVWGDGGAKLIGTRADLLAEGVAPARLARADRYGTSNATYDMPAPYPRPFRDGGWDDTGFIVRYQEGAPSHGDGWLPRARMAAFLAAKAAKDEAAAGALLDPLDED